MSDVYLVYFPLTVNNEMKSRASNTTVIWNGNLRSVISTRFVLLVALKLITLFVECVPSYACFCLVSIKDTRFRQSTFLAGGIHAEGTAVWRHHTLHAALRLGGCSRHNWLIIRNLTMNNSPFRASRHFAVSHETSKVLYFEGYFDKLCFKIVCYWMYWFLVKVIYHITVYTIFWLKLYETCVC